jgi:hypothetical protein
LPVKKFTTNDIISEDVFYNDEKEITFTFPGIEPQARTILKYSEEILDPHFLGGFFFASYLPTVEAVTEVHVHKDVVLGYRLFNADSLQFEISQSGDYQVFRWKAKKLPAIESYDNAPAATYYEPHIWFHIRAFRIKGKSEKFLSDVSDLYKWYYEFIRNSDKADNSALRTFADTLCADAKTPVLKAKKIYEWVQNHIKYVAFEQGLRGFTPEMPENVFEKRYGDCKDMSSLLVALMRLNGLKAHLAWVGTRDLPYRYEDLPTPAVDDHMIVVVFSDDKIFFLDATSPYTPFGMPTAFIQGKEALVAVDEKQYLILPVPVMPAEHNKITDSVHLYIENGILTAKGVYGMTGYPRVLFTEHIAENSESQVLSIRRLLQGENKYFDTLHYDFENFETNEKPLFLRYYWQTKNYHKTSNGELFINLYLQQLWKGRFLNTQRRSPVETQYHFEQTNVVVLHLPPDYFIRDLPEKSEYRHGDFCFETFFTADDTRVIMTIKIRSSFLLLPSEKFDRWNEMTEKINHAYRQSLYLLQKQ